MVRLFEIDYGCLEKLIGDAEPLRNEDDFKFFDAYSDGDDFEGDEYIKKFHLIMRVMKNKFPLEFVVRNRQGKGYSITDVPYGIEYSRRHDKFRVLLVGKSSSRILNVGRSQK